MELRRIGFWLTYPHLYSNRFQNCILALIKLSIFFFEEIGYMFLWLHFLCLFWLVNGITTCALIKRDACVDDLSFSYSFHTTLKLEFSIPLSYRKSFVDINAKARSCVFCILVIRFRYKLVFWYIRTSKYEILIWVILESCWLLK